MKSKYISNGKVDEFNLSKQNKYLSAFATPYESLVDNYTLSLLHFDESVTKDECENEWNTVGNPIISSDNFKFKNSLYLNGNSYLYSESISYLVGDSPFTIDFWLNPSIVSENRKIFLTYNVNYGTSGTGTNYWIGLSLDPSKKILLNLYGNDHTGINTLEPNTWYHVALTYDKSNLKVYLNGNLEITYSHSVKLGGNFVIGFTTYGGNSTTYLKGYIDEFRISNIVRWNSNFTPPTEPYSGDSNSSQLSPAYSNMIKVIN